MVDNYLPIFDVEQQKLKSKNIEENLNRLLMDVSENENVTLKEIIDSNS
jgi:hypothetical protein